MQDFQLTLYSFVNSPYAHRVQIALEEAHAVYTLCEVNPVPGIKPAWYTANVNPAGKVPALVYTPGREPTATSTPEEPPEGCVKFAESLVIVQFVADLFPASGLLPASVVGRARARAFIADFEAEYIPAFKRVVYRGEPVSELLAALEKVQAFLPKEEDGPFVLGEWSVADVVAAPFMVRLWMVLENDIGRYPVGEGPRAFEILQEGARFVRLRRYVEDVMRRPSVANTWDEAANIEGWSKYIARPTDLLVAIR